MPDGREESDERIVVRGCTIALRRRGVAVPSIVFISGRGDSGRVWAPVLAQRDVPGNEITYDRPGTGHSDDLPAELAQVPRPASWIAGHLADLLAAADVTTPVVLVGHSLGGQIADAFAVRWPEKVSGLVLVDSVDPELQLDIVPPHPLIDDAAKDRAGAGWLWDVQASAQEFRATQPAVRPPTIVIASAIWRWFDAKEPDRYRPFTLAQVDQRWQHAQLEYAERWQGQLIAAHDAGHRVHEEAPGLVAAAVDAVVATVKARTALELDRDLLHRSGGSLRPTSSAG
jgi:pimeloyl-ACP methyl ester carboxylesterase